MVFSQTCVRISNNGVAKQTIKGEIMNLRMAEIDQSRTPSRLVTNPYDTKVQCYQFVFRSRNALLYDRTIIMYLLWTYFSYHFVQHSLVVLLLDKMNKTDQIISKSLLSIFTWVP